MSEAIFSSGAIVIFVMFILYMVIGALLEMNHSIIGHESGIIILIGMLISFCAWFIEELDFNHLMEFD